MLRSRAPVPTSCHCSATPLEALSYIELVFAAFVIVLAYAVRGSAGFGGQAIAVPLLALILPFQMVLSAIVVLTVLSAIGHLRRDWSKIDWREIRRLLPYSVLGILAGLLLLERLDIRVLTRAFGVFVIFYACFALATASRPLAIPARALYPAGAVLSALAGATGATFGAAAGPLFVIYFSARQLEKDVFRVTITAILTAQGCLRMAGYARLGFFDETTPVLVAAGLPLMLLGSGIGHWLAGRLDQRYFNAGVSALLLLCGAALLLK
jgi:uncharacterized membrane protein YfcA